MARKEKSILRQMIDERGIKDIKDVQELVKELTSGLIQEIMDPNWKTSLATANMTTKTKLGATAATADIAKPSVAVRVRLS